jgi:hypothetical protein
MRKITFFLLFSFTLLHAQNEITFEDDSYLEDQIYFSLTYIKLTELPAPFSQTGFSYGLGFGGIRDLPLNKRRNFGLGVGLGYSVNINYFNVKEAIPLQPQNTSNTLKSNKVTTHSLEMPFELRFRTSTSQKYKFWRLYPGFKMGYIFATNSNLKQREDFQVDDIIEISKFNYGLTFSAGYNKWNFHLYYGLNDLFTEAENNSYTIGIQDLRLGLIFYIY